MCAWRTKHKCGKHSANRLCAATQMQQPRSIYAFIYNLLSSVEHARASSMFDHTVTNRTIRYRVCSLARRRSKTTCAAESYGSAIQRKWRTSRMAHRHSECILRMRMDRARFGCTKSTNPFTPYMAGIQALVSGSVTTVTAFTVTIAGMTTTTNHSTRGGTTCVYIFATIAS